MRGNAHLPGAPGLVAPRRGALQRAPVLALGAIGAGLAGAPILRQPQALLVWNASASAPIGLYRVEPGATLRRGDMVAAAAPPLFRRLAAERGYLPLTARLIKHVAALGGDRVCAEGPLLFINGRVAALRLKADFRGLPLSWWRGCGQLPEGEFLLLGEGPRSFDARYFGPVGSDLVLGKAIKLWAR